MSLTTSVKAEAHRLGFDLVGVTTSHPPKSYSQYSRWLDAGYHGEMGYLATERARNRRADPREILPDCKSIIVLGLLYNKSSEITQPADDNSRGQVAAYAWGEDYHDVIPKKLQALIEFIEKELSAPINYRLYTDTGPILERDLAQRAGLGWIGKNSMLINPKIGSYFFLAEILLDAELTPNPAFSPEYCGTCTRCIQSCPTDCILPNRVIDARRCISYLTIELKGAIPIELRPLTGDWAFGCDICQQVCPWNEHFAPVEGSPEFAPRPTVEINSLQQELSLSPEDFNQQFKGSPVKRAKRRGYLRNIAVTLGNSADPNAIPALAQALLTDNEALVRGHAAWALGQYGTQEAIQALEQAAVSETDEWVGEEIQIALVK